MSGKCEDCGHCRYWGGSYWEQPDWECAIEDDLVQYEDEFDISELGDTVPCPLWTEIVPEDPPPDI